MADNEPIYDAGKLGALKIGILGFQHLFAMFGATIIFPVLTGLPVLTTLFCSGIGTLLFHLITKGKVPAFLGSSFAFITIFMAGAKYAAADGISETEALVYVCLATSVSSLIYFIFAVIIKFAGAKNILKIFPPVVTSCIIIAIGLSLAGHALQDARTNWIISLTALIVLIGCSCFGKGIFLIIPVLLGVIVSSIVGVFLGEFDFTSVKNAPWVGFPISKEYTIFGISNFNAAIFLRNISITLPLFFVTVMEHIGDISAISAVTDRNIAEETGLHRTLAGDGLATFVAGLLGGPANTTYSENTGTLFLTKVYDPFVIRVTAVIAIIFSFCPKVEALIQSIPAATLGGVSLVLYGLISVSGLKNLITNKVDLNNQKNVIIISVMLIFAIGIRYGLNDEFRIGNINFSGLAVSCVVGVLLNIVFCIIEKIKSSAKKSVISE